MKYSKLFALFLVLIASKSPVTQAQIVNMTPEISNEDITEIFGLMGLSTFKLPIPQQKSPLFINFVLEEYKDSELIYTETFISQERYNELSSFGLTNYLPKTTDSTVTISFYSHINDTSSTLKLDAGVVNWKKI